MARHGPRSHSFSIQSSELPLCRKDSGRTRAGPHQVKASIFLHTTQLVNQQTKLFWRACLLKPPFQVQSGSHCSLLYFVLYYFIMFFPLPFILLILSSTPTHPHCCTLDCLWWLELSALWGKGPLLELSGTQRNTELRAGTQCLWTMNER